MTCCHLWLLVRCSSYLCLISITLLPLQEASLFKLSSLQHQLSESVPRAVLEKANQEYSELVIKYQQCLQKQTAYAADTAAMERLQVHMGE